MMLRNVIRTVLVIVLVVGSTQLRAAELSVGNLSMTQGGSEMVVVSGTLSAESTYGVTIYVELVPRAGALGTVSFTAAPPTDVTQLGDPWPGLGTFSAYDTDITGMASLNGSVDDDGVFLSAPVTYAGPLTGFPVEASLDAEGVWDVVLGTSVGNSGWEALTTTLVSGTVTVTQAECFGDADCDDAVGCTDDACVIGSCVNTVNHTNCPDDGLYCTGTEFCDAVLDCLSTGDPCPIDEFCNETADTCDECLGDGDCDDGVGCTDDTCAAGLCVFTANDLNCPDDGLYCTGTESCDVALDCLSTGDPCEAGTFCNEGTDTCDECLGDGDCNDGVGCTDDTCVGGTCAFTPNDLNCSDDGLFCNGTEFCDAILGCSSSGNPCTPQACDEATDACVGCVLDSDCDDFNVCTDNTCNAGSCEYTNNTAACDDGLFCTVTDVCSSGACAGSGNPCTAPDVCSELLDACVGCLVAADCEDGNPCTDDVCDAAGGCQNPYNTAPCDDGLFCTLADVCSAGACVGSGDRCPGQVCNEDANTCVDAEASLSVENGYLFPGAVGSVVVGGTIAGFNTFGVTIYVELVSRAGNVGTVSFTAAPPSDVSQTGDAWPGTGTFTAYDTDWTASSLLNGAVDDNGTFIPGPVNFDGLLAAFPVVSTTDAGGIWDVVLSTSVGDSGWEGVPTTLVAGTITVAPNVSLEAASFAMPPNATVDLVVSGEVDDEPTYGVMILAELVPRAGAVGTLTFTPAPPVDIYQLGDPWPASGVMSPYDTDATGSLTLNGYIDDNGSFLASPLSYLGPLGAFPVSSSADANGIWDVRLRTSAGVSTWEGLITVLADGVINVSPDACVTDLDCDDANSCTTDDCVAGVCSYTNVTGACDDGDPCTENDVCQGDVCVGTAVDCSGLDDTCRVGVCNAETGVCEGLPRNEGSTCDDSDLCTLGDLCVSGTCTGTAVDCSSLDDTCNVGTCNSLTGICEALPANEGGTCDDGDSCTENDVCSNGVCAGTAVDCTGLDDDCNLGLCDPATGNCIVQFVNQGGSCDDGDLCTRPDVCTDGVCAGAPVDCTALDDDCNVGVCNGATGLCEAVTVNEGGGCDDLDPCTDGDICTDGFCAGVFIPDCENCETASQCNDGNVCTLDECIGGVCVRTDLTDPCNDGDLCTTNDVCSAGVCAGTPVDCSYLDDACNVGVCNAYTGTCLIETANEGGSCNDGSPCTTGDVCVNGVCKGTLIDPAGVSLSWSPPAQTVSVGETAQIQLLASSDTCIEQPVGGIDVILNWDPSVVALQGRIRPTPHIWMISTFPNDFGLDGLNAPFSGIPANDGDALYQVLSSLQTGIKVAPSGTVVVTFQFQALDGSAGSTVSIVPTAGVYSESRVLGAADWLGQDITGALGSATIRVTECGSNSECNDANPCTTDVCNAGVCEHVNNTAPCDDGFYCTSADTCSGGVCVGGSSPCVAPLVCSETLDACVECLGPSDCADGNICTDDLCDANGICSNPNNSLSCNDGLWCTTADQCTGGVCLGSGDACPGAVCDEAGDRCVECLSDGDCEDNNPCTDDACDANVCTHVNNTDSCNDGLYCTQTDTCSGGVCVGVGDPCDPQSSTPVCSEALNQCVECETNAQCNDGNVCTTDLCLMNVCTNNANNLPCDDGLFCTATDICSATVCVGTGDACPGQLCDESSNVCVDCFTVADCSDDGLACTVDGCVNGACVYAPDDTVCDDGLFCNGPEFCHTVLGCQPGQSPCDDPALCDEQNQSCGCQEPVAVAEGCRYLGVTPLVGSTPVALLVTGVDPAVACVSLYVQADGTLGPAPVYRVPRGMSGWNTVHVHDLEVLPETTYVVQSECETGEGLGLSSSASATTWLWADTDNSGGLVSILDVTLIVDGFRGVYDVASPQAVDLWGGSPTNCRPQGVIDVFDMSLAVDAFRQFPYPCPVEPCP
jgi:hypothetical protein